MNAPKIARAAKALREINKILDVDLEAHIIAIYPHARLTHANARFVLGGMGLVLGQDPGGYWIDSWAKATPTSEGWVIALKQGDVLVSTVGELCELLDAHGVKGRL